jgi:ribose transport system substrate-binding protein
MVKKESRYAAGPSRRDFLRGAAAAGVLLPFGGALLAACGDDDGEDDAATSPGDSPSAGSDLSILASLFTVGNIYYSTYAQGAEQAASALGIEFSTNVSNDDFNAQIGAIENAPAGGAQGLIAQVTTAAEASQVVRLAQSLGLPTVTNHNSAEWEPDTPYDVGSNFLAFHALDGITAFKATAVAAFEELGGEGNVLYITGNEGHSADTHRTIGFHEALDEYPDINLLEERSGFWNRVDARPVIDNLLTRYDDVAAIICSNDEEALAAVAAVEERGLTAVITGFDAVPEMLALIEQDRAFATFAQHPTWLGGFSLVRVFDALNGWTPSPLERMMYIGGFVIDTPESATAYEEVMYGEQSPYDWKKMSRTLNPDDWDPQNALAPIDLERLWSAQPKPDGYEFPPDYASAWPAETEEVTALYAEQFKVDPLDSVRQLTTAGREISLTG